MNEVRMITHEEFDSIFDEALSRSPFDRCDYSGILGEHRSCFIFRDELGIVCGIILYFEGPEPKSLPADFIPYNQILTYPGVKYGTERCLVAEKYLIRYLAKKYGRFEYISNPRKNDVRSALFLEHDDERISVSVKLRYTASLSLTSGCSIEEIRAKYKARRRSGMKKARKLGYKVSDTYHINELKSMYVSTFERQNIQVSANTLIKLEDIVEYALKNRGYVVMVRDVNGQASSAAVCLTDRDTAYSVFILNQKSKIRDECSSLCVDAAIDRSLELGLAQFDFAGANSPGRGDFKLSFGADLIPYFHLGVTFA